MISTYEKINKYDIFAVFFSTLFNRLVANPIGDGN